MSGGADLSPLAEALLAAPKLSRLEFTGVPVGEHPKQMESILKVVKRHPSGLANLYFHNCRIGPRAAKQIASALRECPKLEELTLSGNADLGDDGLAALAAELEEGRPVEGDGGGDNDDGDVGDNGCARKTKEKTCQLVRLNLWGCGLTDGGAVCLARSLKRNTKLRRLNLALNHGITSQGIESFLADLLHCNYALEHVDCCRCHPTVDAELRDRVDRMCLANVRAKKRARRIDAANGNIPPALWPLALERHVGDKPDLLFQFLASNVGGLVAATSAPVSKAKRSTASPPTESGNDRRGNKRQAVPKGRR